MPDPQAPVVTPDAPPVDAPEAKALTMPAAVKEGLSAGLAACLDTLSSLAEMISGATVDDAADVPTEPLTMLDEASGMLDALADQFIMEEPTEMAAPSADGAIKSATKAKIADDAMPRRKMRLIAKKRLTSMKGAAKTIEDGHATITAGLGQLGELAKELAGEMSSAPKTEKKTEKSVGEQVADALAPVLAKLVSVEKGMTSSAALAPIVERLSKVEKAAPAPNGQREETRAPGAPGTEREPTYRELLARSQSQKT